MGQDEDRFIVRGDKPEYIPGDEGIGYELFRALNVFKGRIAQHLVESNEIDTFDDLKDRSVRTAIHLEKKGITRDDIICSCSFNQKDSCVPLYASLFLGVKFAPLEPTLPPEHLKYLLDYIKPKVLFISAAVQDAISKHLEGADWPCEVIVFGNTSKYTPFSDYLQPMPEEKTFKPIILKSSKETAFIFFSSGTTGTPKGICCSHYAILAQSVNFYHTFQSGYEISLSNYNHKFNDELEFNGNSSSPLYWVSGTLHAIMGLITGATRIIMPKFDPKEIWGILEKFKVNIFFLQPSQGNDMYANGVPPGTNLSQLKVLTAAGAVVTEQHLKNLIELFPNANVTQLYGLTETSGPAVAFDSRKQEDLEFLRTRLTSCGRALPGFKYKIVDQDSDEAVGPYAHGELRIKSSCLLNGYWNLDDSELFDENGWFKTGDLAYYDEDYCFYIIDRIKDMLKYSIYTIKPSIIEAVLLQHPSVHESFVLGIPHQRDNEHPMGIVVLKSSHQDVKSEAICDFVNENVPDRYQLRAGVTIVDKMMRTPTGKIRKLAMRKLILEGKL